MVMDARDYCGWEENNVKCKAEKCKRKKDPSNTPAG